MPFELGLAIREALVNPNHSWYIFETVRYRTEKSLSNFAGTDVYVHGGTIRGVLKQLLNAFIRQERQPTLQEMMAVYRYVRAELPSILKSSGSESVFDGAKAFTDVYMAACLKAEGLI